MDLSEYLTYILFEHQEREIMYDMSKPIPYPNNPREFTSKNLALDLYISVNRSIGIIPRGKFPLDSFNSSPVSSKQVHISIRSIAPMEDTYPSHGMDWFHTGRQRWNSSENRKFNQSNRESSKTKPDLTNNLRRIFIEIFPYGSHACACYPIWITSSSPPRNVI